MLLSTCFYVVTHYAYEHKFCVGVNTYVQCLFFTFNIYFCDLWMLIHEELIQFILIICFSLLFNNASFIYTFPYQRTFVRFFQYFSIAKHYLNKVCNRWTQDVYREILGYRVIHIQLNRFFLNALQSEISIHSPTSVFESCYFTIFFPALGNLSNFKLIVSVGPLLKCLLYSSGLFYYP